MSKINRPTLIASKIADEAASQCHGKGNFKIKTCIGEYIQQRKLEVCPGLNDKIFILTTPNEVRGNSYTSFGLYKVRTSIQTFNIAISCCFKCWKDK